MDSLLCSVLLRNRIAFFFSLLLICFFSSVKSLCLSHERIALLQLKDSFIIDEHASGAIIPSNPKVTSWASKGSNSDCCAWDGIKCDNITGHVVALDLTSSWLSGAIDSTSSLFQLSHLQNLSLADNEFSYSQIPSRLSNLSRLVYLDLSYSDFKGPIPSEISQLSGLVSLDLSGAHINSTVPPFLTNLSSLVTLRLVDCYLYGEFPKFIFQLPNLRILNLARNTYLFGSLPEFYFGLHLQKLLLQGTGLSGTIPSSIENLDSLNVLNLEACEFSGLLPSSLGKLKKLTYLVLSYNNFIGPIPSFLQNLTHLNELWLRNNQFSGQIPAWLGNLTQLTMLQLGFNKLHGEVPHSFSRLANLEALLLRDNELSGTLVIDMFLNLKYLSILQLSYNRLSVLTETSNPNATVSHFEILQLGSCNLKSFPKFLRYQQKLQVLYLDENQIYGRIPRWVLNTSTQSLVELVLSNNSLTGFDHSPPVILPWVRLASLDLSQNMLKGSIPIPPASVIRYKVSNNKLCGKISPLFCNISSPAMLDLSNNQLNLGNNYFNVMIPRIGMNGSNLVAIDLSNNQLGAPLPRSLANCSELGILNLRNIKLDDGFPSWLGTLPELIVLVLRQNHLHGVIKEPTSKFEFPKLQVIDLSHNTFLGLLPSQYFNQWKAMTHVDFGNSSYLKELFVTYSLGNYTYRDSYIYSMNITNRGNDIAYERIQEAFVVMDFSSNRFEGEIPDCIGSLRGLQVLDLSNNVLTGSIPTSMENMTRLESLDLSQNRLSGEIPPQLVQLTFLAFLNVSQNNLTGIIPRAKQFNTFENSSFLGNLRLCGDPLSKKCEKSESHTPPSSSSEEEDSGSLFEFNWMIILFGYLGGLVVGIAIEHIVATECGWSGTKFFMQKLKLREWRRHRA